MPLLSDMQRARSNESASGGFPPVSYPIERVCANLIELPTCFSGNKYFLTIVDHFIKYFPVYPFRNKSAEVVSETLMQFIAETGCPLEIVSRQGGICE